MQELQAMNIQMRIITEDNINQLDTMSFSNNINNYYILMQIQMILLIMLKVY